MGSPYLVSHNLREVSSFFVGNYLITLYEIKKM